METAPPLRPRDLVAIRRLVAIDHYEIRHFTDETRLRFNALAPVRSFVLAVEVEGRRGEIELFHWVEDDDWELVHSTLD